MNLQGVTTNGPSTTDAITITNTTQATTTSTGALKVSGGIAAAKDIRAANVVVSRVGVGLTAGANPDPAHLVEVDGNVKATNVICESLTLDSVALQTLYSLDQVVNVNNTTSNIVIISNTTPSTSMSTGCLQLSGGLGVNGNVYAQEFVNTNAGGWRLTHTHSTRPTVNGATVGGELTGGNGDVETGFLRLSGGGSTAGTGAPKSYIDICGASASTDFANNITFGIKGSEKVRLTDVGLGLGITSPTNKLHIQLNAGDPTGELVKLTDSTRSLVMGVDSNHPWVGTSSAHDLRLITNNNSRIHIKSDGHVHLMGTNQLGIGYSGGAFPGTTSLLNTKAWSQTDDTWEDMWHHAFDANWNLRMAQYHDVGSEVKFGIKQRYNTAEYTPLTFRGNRIGIFKEDPVYTLDCGPLANGGGGMRITRHNGQNVALRIDDQNLTNDGSGTRAAGDQYQFILSAPRPGQSENGLTMFINSANRTQDGGASCATIRNDNGPIRFGSAAYRTFVEKICPASLDTTVGSIIYDLSNAVTGHYLYQDIMAAPIANTIQTWQRQVQIVRAGSLVTISGYIVFQTTSSTPYLYFSWGQLGFETAHNMNTVWNGSTFTTGTLSGAPYAGHDVNYVYIYFPGPTQSPNIVYTNVRFVLDMAHVSAYG